MGKQNIEGGQAAPLRTVGYLLGASTLVLHHEVRGKSVGLNPWDLRWWRGEGLATTITGILADLGRLSLYLQIPSCFPNEQLCSPIEETCGYTLTGGLQGVQICLIRILKGGVLLALEPRLPIPVQGAKSQPPPPPVVESVFWPPLTSRAEDNVCNLCILAALEPRGGWVELIVCWAKPVALFSPETWSVGWLELELRQQTKIFTGFRAASPTAPELKT